MSATLVIRTAQLDDAATLAPRLREADLREIAAATGEGALEVLRRGVAASVPALSAVDTRGCVQALFGVVPRGDGSGLIWLLGSDELALHRRALLSLGRAWVQQLQQRYPRLWNHLDARNDVHLRWLLRCGFRAVSTDLHHGVERRPFHEVERLRAWSPEVA